MLTHNLGYPRIGAARELKKACENYWAGKISATELETAGKKERTKNLLLQKEIGLDLIPCNDFSFYDQMLDHSVMFGAIPERFTSAESLSGTDLYFAMARGYQSVQHDIAAMEMTKWFNTNYHYIVPEFTKDQEFHIDSSKIISEFLEAKELIGSKAKPVLIGPVTYLLSGKETEPGFHRLDLIYKLLPLYKELLSKLQEFGCKYIQIDEPALVTVIDENTKQLYKEVYKELTVYSKGPAIILTTYFDTIIDTVDILSDLPVYAVHADCTDEVHAETIINSFEKSNCMLSMGLVDGRNIWKNNYDKSLSIIKKAFDKLGSARVMIAPTTSLLHCPYDLEAEKDNDAIPEEVKNWLAFAKQKLGEIKTLQLLSEALKQGKQFVSKIYIQNTIDIGLRANSGIVHNEKVAQKLKESKKKEYKRDSDFAKRIEIQNKELSLPLFPTTTVGSFPQTGELRLKRREYKNNTCTTGEYEHFISKEIENSIRVQEEIGLDVLVHGEFERNDMVEYFAEKFEGFTFTRHGWVQSYGSRCVKPPVIFGDVQRKAPISIQWIKYAQSLTAKPVKGMLTGPVTILQWSFVRDDQPREDTAFQIALALNEEVLDLEKSGVKIIQVDEPALREGLPLKSYDKTDYLDWAMKAFRLCVSGVKDKTQIHTHMCYANFNDIMEAIAEMDADVISIETSRSRMELLDVFKEYKYPNHIGPGVYDIHSSRIPSVEEMYILIKEACKKLSPSQVWINPDCGLKTRKWDEVIPALKNMVQTASDLRMNLN